MKKLIVLLLSIIFALFEAQAQTQTEHAAAVKAAIDWMKDASNREGRAVGEVADSLLGAGAQMPPPARNLMNFVTGRLYLNYLQDNWRRIGERTSAPEAGGDIETWDAQRIFAEVVRLYRLAVEEASETLQATPIDYFGSDLDEWRNRMPPEAFELMIGNNHAKQISHIERFFPSLYESMTFNVIGSLRHGLDRLARTWPRLGEREQSTVEETITMFYERLLRHNRQRLEQGKSALPLIAMEVERLRFLRSWDTESDAEQRYEDALRQLAEEYREHPESAYPLLAVAALYREQGERWQRDRADETLRTKYIKALALADEVAKRWPELAVRTRALRAVITTPSLELKLGRGQYPDEPFLALATVRNVERIYLQAYALDERAELALSSRDRIREWLQGRRPAMTMQSPAIPSRGDHQPFAAQFAIDGLPQGSYLVVASHEPPAAWTFGGEFRSAMAWVNVSPLTYSLRQGTRRTFGLAGTANEPITQIYVTDARSGSVVAGAAVEIFRNEYDVPQDMRQSTPVSIGRYTTDRSGVAYIEHTVQQNDISQVIINNLRQATLVIETRDGRRLEDRIWAHNFLRSWVQGGDENAEIPPQALFFTDRAIYRPGQTVYYKVLLARGDNEGNKTVVEGYRFEVRLRDVNSRVVGEMTLTTNDFGSADGSFTLPTGLLNGWMTLECDYGSVGFSVEEYKRPMFEVSVTAADDSVPRYGQTVTVHGVATALADYVMDGATVRYRVVRRDNFRFWDWRRPRPNVPQMEITQGEVITDAEGRFAISFIASADGVANREWASSFEVTADVTDINGETRSATVSVAVSDRPLVVQASIPSAIDGRDSLSFPVTVSNLNGKPVSSQVHITVEALDGPGRMLRRNEWHTDLDTTLMTRAEFVRLFPHDIYGRENDPQTYPARARVGELRLRTTGDSPQEVLDLSRLLRRAVAGWYRVSLRAEDGSGNTAEHTHILRLNGTPDGRRTPIVWCDDWLTAVTTTGKAGSDAVYLLAAPTEGTPVRCDIFIGDRLVETRFVEACPTPQEFRVPIAKDLTVQFLMTSGGRTYSTMSRVQIPPEESLRIELSTFRDRLLPGEHERWRLTVKNPDGSVADAEMALTMYDAALEFFRRHSWPQGHLYGRTAAFAPRWMSRESVVRNPSVDRSNYRVPSFSPWIVPNVGVIGRIALGESYEGSTQTIMVSSPQMRSGGEMFAESDANVIVTGMFTRDAASFTGAADGFIPAAVEDDIYNENWSETIAVRRNFNELALFHPQLRTDENGEIAVEFTAPESLTRWRVLGFAHTQQMRTGNIIREIVTRKEVAVSVNVPRFLREGDTVRLAARVNNVTENALSGGEARLQIFDAETMQPLDALLISAEAVPFDVAAGQSSGVQWTLTVPEGIAGITVRVTARAGAHTDGEERTIPVLPRAILVTETMPFAVKAGQERTFDFVRLRENAVGVQRNHSLTLEFTSNPAWYALLAMPYLMEFPYDCSEQVFSRFFANSLSVAVAQSSPEIERTFEQWRETEADALMSNLERNPELRSALLEETPWVAQAQNQAERKRRIGELFDRERMAAGQRAALERLANMQNGNGTFSWFDGMPPDRFMTQHIVAGFGQLMRAGALADEHAEQAQQIVQRALVSLDWWIRNDYENPPQNRRRSDGQLLFHIIHLHYLYAASFYDHKPAGREAREAFDYAYEMMRETWRQHSNNRHSNIYWLGLTALVLHRYGDTEKAQEVVETLRALSTGSEETGMYWNMTDSGPWGPPVETQALMISVFDEVAGDAKAVDDMKIWQLRQKQTSDWRTTRATAEACYALLMTGGSLLTENLPLDVAVGGQPVTVERAEAGSGYVKRVWGGSEITPALAQVKAENPNTRGVAWGGLYWQYFEDADKITSDTQMGLNVEKQLFLRRNTPRGPELVPLVAGNTVGVGDLITVRLVINTDRYLNYVHLRDMRAAGFEPVQTLSGYRSQGELWYYENVKDASVNFFFGGMTRGTHVLEYDLRATHAGHFLNGIATIQCMYEPAFTSHSTGIRLVIK
ncbi:MAG: MG2 domain-containing protein [Rikenellaceae bacterium]|nr:MG2 domain-containing protein [Rikenellaceae bacterium]MCL2693194.1 MG2 domain-containing protein [Rikenellaceae bacterium]